MEYLKYANPLYLYEGIRDGTLAEKVDNRILSALVVYFGLKIAHRFIFRPTLTFGRYFLRPAHDLHSRYGGGWAVVTGASDGIGLGYSKTLAQQGFNVLMISRNSVKLDKAAQEVMKVNTKVLVRTIEFDFNRPYTKEAYQPIYNVLDEIKDIAILINNVGYGSNDPAILHELSDDNVTSVFQINTIPLVYMTKYCLKLMVAREGKRSGILNLSSVSALFKRGSNLYPSTKAFVGAFTECLANDPKYKGIDFLNLYTASVSSQMNRSKVLMTVTADDYAKQSLRHLGYETVDHGHWKHTLMMTLIRNPITAIPFIISFYNNAGLLGRTDTQTPVQADK